MIHGDQLVDTYEGLKRTGPQPGDHYRHFKGGEYEIVCLALDSGTLEATVVYKSLKNGVVFTRKLSEFGDRLGDSTHRFELIAKSGT